MGLIDSYYNALATYGNRGQPCHRFIIEDKESSALIYFSACDKEGGLIVICARPLKALGKFLFSK